MRNATDTTLSHEEAQRFYDRFGAKQDWQRFYEDRAISELVAHGALADAQSVVEFGCGTGRIARHRGCRGPHADPHAVVPRRDAGA